MIPDVGVSRVVFSRVWVKPVNIYILLSLVKPSKKVTLLVSTFRLELSVFCVWVKLKPNIPTTTVTEL